MTMCSMCPAQQYYTHLFTQSLVLASQKGEENTLQFGGEQNRSQLRMGVLYFTLYSKYVLSDLNVIVSWLYRSSSSSILKLVLVFVSSSLEYHMGGVFCHWLFKLFQIIHGEKYQTISTIFCNCFNRTTPCTFI